MKNLSNLELNVADLNKEQLESEVLREDILLKQQQRKISARPWFFRAETILPILMSILGISGWGVSCSSKNSALNKLDLAEGDLVGLTQTAGNGVADLRAQIEYLQAALASVLATSASKPELAEEEGKEPSSVASPEAAPPVSELINPKLGLIFNPGRPMRLDYSTPRINFLDTELLRLRAQYPTRFLSEKSGSEN